MDPEDAETITKLREESLTAESEDARREIREEIEVRNTQAPLYRIVEQNSRQAMLWRAVWWYPQLICSDCNIVVQAIYRAHRKKVRATRSAERERSETPNRSMKYLDDETVVALQEELKNAQDRDTRKVGLVSCRCEHVSLSQQPV